MLEGSRPPLRPRDPAAELIIESDAWFRRVRIEPPGAVLGRSSDCDIPLLDPDLSRRHCRILLSAEGTWLVEDLGSQNGTFVDGVRIQQPTTLSPESRLRLGQLQIRLRRRSAQTALSGDLLHDARNVEILLETIDSLYSTEALDAVLRTILDRTILLAGAERGALFLAGPGGALEVVLARNARGQELPSDQALTRSLPRRALESNRAIVLTDTDLPGQREEASASVLDARLRTILCVPLPGPEGPLGVLYVDGRRPAEEFGPADLAFFEALAVHSAVAIERARLDEEQARREGEARERLEAENAALKGQLNPDQPIAQSRPMLQLIELIRQVAPSEATVCIVGETGTGKEVLASYLHRLSPRAEGPFVVVDCGSLPQSLIESELFGHEKGAYTGADAPRPGRFREADGGTIFLDEIGELPLTMQTRLLRVLQERTVQPIGGKKPVKVDVRFVCATNRDLEQQVAEGLFRKDLYYRLAVVTAAVPPLRERVEDISLLAHLFLARFAAAHGLGLAGFTREAIEALAAHDWPGNVRELQNRIQRAVLVAKPPAVTRRDLGLGGEHAEDRVEQPAASEPVVSLQQARKEATERFEKAYLEAILRQSGGNVSRAAEQAGVSRQMLQRLLQRYSIDRRRFVSQEPQPRATES